MPGLGGVGFSALLGAVASGAGEVIAIDLSDDKLKLALELGATAVFNARDPDCGDRIRELTKGGVDHAFEMTGAIPAMELAWRITRRGGSTISAGLPNPALRFQLPPVALVAEERTLRYPDLRAGWAETMVWGRHACAMRAKRVAELVV